MTDSNAPVRRHLANAKEHLAEARAKREATQALHALWLAEHAQRGAGEPTGPSQGGSA